MKIASLKDDCKLYASLYVACQSRSGDLADFFAHENHSYPPSISEYGKLRKCTKSDFVSILESTGTTKETPPADVTAKVFDGAAVVQMMRSQAAKTYGEYSRDIFWPFVVNSQDGSVRRLDVVFDVYTERSLKVETRERRGKGVRIAVKRIHLYGKTGNNSCR
jgi:trehalose-6-phosphate synthase